MLNALNWKTVILSFNKLNLLILLVFKVLFLTEDIDESVYIFSPDTYPHQRQQFYQLCDLRDDTLQGNIHNNDGKETSCHVRIINNTLYH